MLLRSGSYITTASSDGGITTSTSYSWIGMSFYISLANLSERYASPGACIAFSPTGNAYNANLHAGGSPSVAPRLDLLRCHIHLADDLQCRMLLKMLIVPDCIHWPL